MVETGWSRRFIEDLYAAAEYHRPFSATFANALIDRVFEKGALLETHPLPERRVPETTRADVRELHHKQYRLICQVLTATEIRMVALHHGAQRLEVGALVG